MLVALVVAITAVIAVACVPVAPRPSPRTTSPPSTAPASTLPAPVTGATAGFVAFADAGMGDATQAAVAQRLQQWAATGHRTDALVEAGDNVYPDGNPARYAATLDQPYATLRSTRPLWVALGNHDVQAGYGDEELAHLGMPALPATRTLPGVQLLFVDSNQPDVSQAQWLEAQLSAPGPALRVVVFHHPAYACATHGSTQAVVDAWVPVLEAHRVALVVNGHDHYYERFRSANGVTYVVTGGGGAAIYPRRAACSGVPPSYATAATHHFVGVEVRGTTLTLTAVDRSGNVIDRTTIVR
jgi:3',5'-cyclic AMP phosphodiesterase CpdA